jgi:putative ABC transport system permease protein
MRDLSYGLRLIRRAPGFSALVAGTLALGIGVNTAVFSILHAVLLEPLPYRDSGRLVAIWDREIHAKGTSKLFDLYSDYENWKADAKSFEKVAALTWAAPMGRVMTGRGQARTVMAIPVTGEFFSLLGVAPALGRTFQAADVGGGCSVVLADSFWRNVLGGNASIVGETLRLDDQGCTVLGVMTSGFAFLPPEAPVTMWALMDRPAKPDSLAVGVFARLRRGAKMEAAQAEVLALHRQIHAHDRWGAQVEPVVYDLHGEFTWLTGRNLRLSVLVLFGAVSFVLLICCVNVANLLLGRALGRRREMALRAALGSGRARLMRQLLAENLMLSIAASLAGAGLAGAAVDYFRAARPVEMPPGVVVSLSAPVLAFTAMLTVVTAGLFGLAPAWSASRVNLSEALKTGGRSTAAGGPGQLGKGLIVAEVMLTVILLAGAGMLIQTMRRFEDAPLGLNPDGLVTALVQLPKTSYADSFQRAQFYERLETELRAIPGVQVAALSNARPISGGGALDVMEVEGHEQPRIENQFDTHIQIVSGDYFRALGTPLQQGRFFESGDREGSEAVAIVNAELARRYFAGENPLGKHVRPFQSGTGERPWLRVVGVVGNEKRTTVYQEMAWVDTPILYRPVAQNPPGSLSVVLRAPYEAGAAIRRKVAAIDAGVPVQDVQTVRSLEARVLAYPRFRAALLGAFAALALFLAAVGLFGVLSHRVSQRTHEIGVRMALGAQQDAVQAMILRGGLALVAAGVVLGAAAVWGLQRYLGSLLYGMHGADLRTIAGSIGVLLAAAVAAIWVPARRASRVDPMVTLKWE